MRYNNLDGLDIKPSCIGLGCLQLGGHGWGKVSESEMVNAVHKAIDSGINFLDTAPIYGLGHSEEVLGNTLKSFGLENNPVEYGDLDMDKILEANYIIS